MPIMTRGVDHTLTVDVAKTAAMTNGKSHATCSTVNAPKMTMTQCAVVKVTKGIAVCCP